MIRPFVFWCHKVLPLVYDDSLSYYEVLCKVVKTLNEALEELQDTQTAVESLRAELERFEEYVEHYFDNLDVQEEINNKLDTMAESGELDEILGEWLNRTTLKETVDSDIYGQLLFSDIYGSDYAYYPQGHVIFRHNNDKVYAMVGRVNSNADPTRCIMEISELRYDNDGRLNSVDNYTMNVAGLGHCNCMTYCTADKLVYIACGGGDNGIAKIVGFDPLTFTIEKTYDYTDDVNLQSCTNICWDESNGVFYVIERGNIFVYDENFTLLRQNATNLGVEFRGNVTGQSSFTDGRFIYTIVQVGNPADVNVLIMHNCNNLSFYKMTNLMIKGEVEGGCFFDGMYLVNRSANRNSLVYRIYPFADNHVGNYTYRNGTRTALIARAEQSTSNDLYCDSDYFGFRVDGDSETYPYNSVYNMLDNAFYNMDSMRIDFHVAGIQPHMFNIKKFTTMRIDGYTGYGEAGSLPGIYIRNGLDLIINGIKVHSSNGLNDSYVSIMDVNNFYMAGVTIEGGDGAEYLLRYPASNGEFTNCKFLATYTGNAIEGTTGGNVVCGTGNQFIENSTTGAFDIYVNRNTVLPRGTNFDVRFYERNTAYDVVTISNPSDFDISKIRRSGIYRIIGSDATFINAPEAVTDNFGFQCTNIGGANIGDESTHHLLIYDVLTNAGVYYKVVMRDTSLTWYDITGTVVETFTVTP